MARMSQMGMPQTPDEWTKYWQEQGRFQNEYAAPKPPGQVPYGFGDFTWRFAYAGWFSRVLATLVDAFLALCLQGLVGGFTYAVTADPMTSLVAAYVVGLPLGLWYLWRNGSPGQTPGKAVLGIRVVHHETGTPIGGPMGLLRGLVGWAISAFTCGLGGLLDVLWPLFDDKNRTLHDMVVGSVVIRDREL